MIVLESTDKLQLVTSAAATVDVVASHVTSTGVAGSNVTPGMTPTAITTATTTDIVAAPAASNYKNVKTVTIRNKHATLSCDVTVILDRSGTDYELAKFTLDPGEVLEFDEQLGFYLIENTALLEQTLRVASDVVNATTSFADITGLTCPMISGRKYAFEAFLFHQTNATTTAAYFGVNIGAAPTSLIVAGANQITSSVTAAGYGAVAAVTARDTAILTAGTTGPGANTFMANIFGSIQPSADGTFAMRLASEVAVASGLTVKAGSFLRVRECNN